MMYAVSLCLFSLTASFFVQTANAQCGVSSIQPQLPQAARRRIINGNTAVANSWPWAVNIFISTADGGSMCGGSLINPSGADGQSDIILTAAHCVMNEDGTVQYPPSAFTATLGAHDMSQNEASQISSKVISVQPHPNYDANSFGVNDIALLKLSAPVSFSQYVQPICLPTPGQQPSNPNQCYAVGWGRISNDNNSIANALQQVLLPILSDDTCGSADVWSGSFDNTMMTCAGYLSGTKATCQGDSGGPLVCTDGDHFTQFGSTSFGYRVCAFANKPSIFARTSSYIDWIQQTASSM